MVNILKIIVLGGDERQKYLTEFLRNKGFITEHIYNSCNLKNKINSCDYIILPLPATKDKITVFNALSDDKIYISDLQEFVMEQKVFTCKLMLEGKNCEDYSLKAEDKAKLGYEFQLLTMSQEIMKVHVLCVEGLKWYEIDDADDLAYAEEHILRYL